MSEDISPKRLFGLILFFAVSYLAFHAVLVGSLPLDAVDDYARIVNAKNASWVDIGQAFFSGRQSFSLLQNSITSLTDRIGQTLFLKILYNLFGERAVFYYYFQYGMGALTMAFLAYFSFRLTRSLWLSMFAALFYFFLPPAFMHNIWLSDFAETVHVLILISFLLFLYLNRRYFRKGRLPDNAGGWAQILLLILLGFLAFKTKPSGYIIPLVVVLFFLFPLHKAFFENKIFLGIFIAVFICGMALFPYKTLGSLHHYHLDSIFKMVFMNTANEFDFEKTSALFNFDSVIPVSLARILGFFIAWTAIVLGVWRLCFCRPLIISDEVRLLMIWLALEVAFFAVSSTEARYLTDSFLPLVMLLCVLFKHSLATTRPSIASSAVPREETRGLDDLKAKFTRRAVVGILIAGLLFNTVNNVQHLIFLRNWRAGLRTVLHAPLNIVYNDYHHQALTTDNRFEDIIRFIHPDYVKRPFATTIYDLTTYCDIPDIGIKSYEAKASDSILKKYGKVYWITRDSKMPPEGFRLIREARMIPESPITHWLAPYKAKKNQEMLLVFGKTLT